MTRAALVDAWETFPVRMAVAACAAVDHPVEVGAWGPAQVVRHLIAVEREVWWSRLASITTEEEPHWSWAEPGLEPGLEDAGLDVILDQYADARARSVGIVARFDEAAWGRTGIHATYGRLDVAGLIGLASAHDAEHLAGVTRRGP